MHQFMRTGFVVGLSIVIAGLSGPIALGDESDAVAPPPFEYVWALAHHVLPETTNHESGYFSLCEGLNRRIYVGTAKYGVNSFLVEFDPTTEQQRIVIDTHKVCGIEGASGYAAQAKLHTRNFVGPSGTIYVGSKQGYRLDKSDTSEYPGGYVMTYDPASETARSLGMPYPTEGVIDIVADESRGIHYIVTCEQQHWMRYDVATGKYRELGPLLTPYAMTLIDAEGRAHAITQDHELATYDPATDVVTVRPLDIDGEGGRLGEKGQGTVPTWVLAADGHTAYLVRMSEATLFEIDLSQTGDVVRAVSRGKLHPGSEPDSRCALSFGPDGRLYAAVLAGNDTGWGENRLHYLVRYDPATQQHENLGVIVVKNPEFMDWAVANGRAHHGYTTLPDGTLTLRYAHLGMIVAGDGTVYMIHLYPYTLLQISLEPGR